MSSRRQQGMGLVELLVWMAISLLIISVIGVVYANTKQLTRVNDTVSRLQENGRFVIHLLDHDIRMAGFRGCNGNDASVAYVSVLDSTAYPYQFDVAIAGFHGYVEGAMLVYLLCQVRGASPRPAAAMSVRFT